MASCMRPVVTWIWLSAVYISVSFKCSLCVCVWVFIRIEIYCMCHLYGCLSVCLNVWLVRLSVRSAHQLAVADSGPVSGLERTAAAAAAGAQRGDQQEAAGKKPRKTGFSFNKNNWWHCVSSLVTSYMSVSSCGHVLQSVWVRKGALRWWRDWKPQRWVDVGVALEQSTKSDGRKDSIFFVYYTQYDEKKVRFTVKSWSLKGLIWTF